MFNVWHHQVYQSLDRELQKHVSHQDTLQQCQTWLSTVKEEIQLQTQTPYGLQEALKQVDATEQESDSVLTVTNQLRRCMNKFRQVSYILQ